MSPKSPSASNGACRDQRGEVLALLILWPAMVVLLVVLAAQALVVIRRPRHTRHIA